MLGGIVDTVWITSNLQDWLTRSLYFNTSTVESSSFTMYATVPVATAQEEEQNTRRVKQSHEQITSGSPSTTRKASRSKSGMDSKRSHQGVYEHRWWWCRGGWIERKRRGRKHIGQFEAVKSNIQRHRLNDTECKVVSNREIEQGWHRVIAESGQFVSKLCPKDAPRQPQPQLQPKL